MVRFFPKLWKIHSDWLEIPELGQKTVLVDKFFWDYLEYRAILTITTIYSGYFVIRYSMCGKLPSAEILLGCG